MDIKNILTIFQIIIAILLSLSILVQAQGTGLGTVFGGSGGVYRSRRGVEKILFWATILLAFLFLASALVLVLIQK